MPGVTIVTQSESGTKVKSVPQGRTPDMLNVPRTISQLDQFSTAIVLGDYVAVQH
jgi:hypothetical protein